jgi:hypothetical protein
MLLTIILGPKRKEVIGSWRKLVGKPEVKKPLGRTRCRREGNIKMGFGKKEWGSMED